MHIASSARVATLSKSHHLPLLIIKLVLISLCSLRLPVHLGICRRWLIFLNFQMETCSTTQSSTTLRLASNSRMNSTQVSRDLMHGRRSSVSVPRLGLTKWPPMETNLSNRRQMTWSCVQSLIKTECLSMRLKGFPIPKLTRRKEDWLSTKNTCTFRPLYFTPLLRERDALECIMPQFHWPISPICHLNTSIQVHCRCISQGVPSKDCLWTRAISLQCSSKLNF